MTERIGIKLTELVENIIDINLSEAETERYPYAVYDYTPVPYHTKDGVYKYQADVTVAVVSNDSTQALAKADEVGAAILEGMEGPEFTARLRSKNADCVEGVWTVEMEFTINQYN